jgi:hypothetical protein
LAEPLTVGVAVTEERLKEIEGHYVDSFPGEHPRGIVLELVAEVRRLQAEVRRLSAITAAESKGKGEP